MWFEIGGLFLLSTQSLIVLVRTYCGQSMYMWDSQYYFINFIEDTTLIIVLLPCFINGTPRSVLIILGTPLTSKSPRLLHHMCCWWWMWIAVENQARNTFNLYISGLSTTTAFAFTVSDTVNFSNILGGSSQDLQVVSNYADRKSPNWGCWTLPNGPAYKWGLLATYLLGWPSK